MEVDQISLSLSEHHISRELINSKLLDDLKDVKLLVKLLLALLEEFVLSSGELTAAEAPWILEPLQFE